MLRTEFRGLHHANSPQRNSHTNCGFYVPTPQAFFSVHWTKSWGIPQTKTCFSSGDGVQMWLQPCYKKQWSFTQPAPGLPEGGCPAISFISYWNKLKWNKDLLAKSLPAPKKTVWFPSLFQLCSQALECPTTNNQGSRLRGGIPQTYKTPPVLWMTLHHNPLSFCLIFGDFLCISLPPPPLPPFSTLSIQANGIMCYKSGHRHQLWMSNSCAPMSSLKFVNVNWQVIFF